MTAVKKPERSGNVGNYKRLTDIQFSKFASLIYQKVGISLKAEKKELLNARLGKRLRACAIDSFEEYYDYVIGDRSGEELIKLFDSVSTNFTSFFREQAHFDFLTATGLSLLMQERAGSRKELLFWSAACSSGEEPYTLAMVLEDFLEKYPDWQYKIYATDISTKVLAQAQQAIYAEDRIDKVPRDFLKKFLQKGTGKAKGYIKIKKVLRQKIIFNRLNLMGKLPWQSELDVIFCRNVMIYFDRATQQVLINKFYQALMSGGYLFIGHSESISSLKHDFKQIATTVYRK